jgi:hypothetical protein
MDTSTFKPIFTIALKSAIDELWQLRQRSAIALQPPKSQLECSS